MLPSIAHWLVLAVTLQFCHATQPIEPRYVKLVDLISASSEHSHLLTALQRARLIPVLNRLNGSTLFAPTNDAIQREIDATHGTSAGELGKIWAYALGPDQSITGGREHDNLQLELRDTLLYHVLNYTVPLVGNSSDLDRTRLSETGTSSSLALSGKRIIDLAETLYHPSLSPFNKSFPRPPSLPGSPRDGPDPDRPHAVEGLLRGEGQKLRWYLDQAAATVGHEDPNSTSVIHVGVDWQGQGGASGDLSKLQNASNGLFVPIDRVLRKPVDIATQIRTNPDLSTLASLLPTSLLEYISSAPHLTVFAPTNQAWEALSELEMRYLQSGLADDDLAQIFGEGASTEGAGKGKVGYLSRLLGKNANDTTEVTTLWNTSLEIRPADDESVPAIVNGTAVTTPDILAMNGAIHTVPSLLLPSGSLALTAEKYLIALNCTRFVSLLRSVNLSHYVQVPVRSNNPSSETRLPDLTQFTLSASLAAGVGEDEDSESYTILAPRDDVIDTHWPQLQAFLAASMPERGTDALRDVLRYHIVRGRWTPDELEDGMLVSTVLETDALKSSSQRLLVSVQRDEGDHDGGDGEDASVAKWWGQAGADQDTERRGRKHKDSGVVGFGGASVIAEPVRVGKSIIYLLSSVLAPPASPITEAVSDLRLSTFVASLYAAELDKELASQPGVTFLMPDNTAFSSLGLVMSYLLLPTAREELRALLRYHAIDKIAYIDDLASADRRLTGYPTLDGGSEIYVEHRRNSSGLGSMAIGGSVSDAIIPSLRIRGPTVGGQPINGDARAGRVLEGDLLTSTGVIHVVDQVELPPELDITIPKLLQGARASTMIDLIRAANLSWVLDGPAKRVQHATGLGLGQSDKKKKKRHGDGTQDDLARNQAYTILCPTDKALSRLNLTRYLSDPPALAALVKLHIIPTDTTLLPGDQHEARPASTGEYTNDDEDDDDDRHGPDDPTSPEDEREAGRAPLSLSDEAAFPTLLDKRAGGTSQYGTVAFRRWGDDGWLVGVKSARGARGQTDAARVVAFGRASPRTVLVDRSQGHDDTEEKEVSLLAGGGVLVIDAVLLPYEPSWLRRWSLSLALALALVLVAGLIVFGLRTWLVRRSGGAKTRYEPVAEGEEDA